MTWEEVRFQDGAAALPGHPRTVAELWSYRIDAGAASASLALEPVTPLAVAVADRDDPASPNRRLWVANWGAAASVLAKAVDAAGRRLVLASSGGSLSKAPGGGWYDLGLLAGADQIEVTVRTNDRTRYPVTVSLKDDAGHEAGCTLRSLQEISNPPVAAWPAETVGTGGWTAYTQLATPISDKTSADGDTSTGGTTPNGDTDISRGGSPYYPSCYYSFKDGVFFYRVRVLGNPLTNGAYNNGTRTGGDPWDNVTWNLLLDTDGDGWKEFNVVLAGDSGGGKNSDISVVAGSNDGDDLKVYYNNGNSQLVTSESVFNNQVTSPGDLVWWGNAGTQDAVVPASKSANGAAWDFGRSRMVYHTAADATWGEGYFVDFQFPLSALTDAYNSGNGGRQLIGVNTPIAFGYSTSNSNSNPLQKDYASSYAYTAGSGTLFPYSDMVTLATGITQSPLVGSMVLAGIVCPSRVTVSVTVADALKVDPPYTGTGTVTDTIASVTFQYSADGGSSWANMPTYGSSINPDTRGDLAPDGLTSAFNNWGVVWNTSALPSGQYPIRVIAVDDQGNTTTKMVGSYVVDTSGTGCRLGNNTSWNSYNDASHLVPADYFGNNPPSTVYMNGSFAPATNYVVAYYDSTGALVYTQTCTSDTFGTMLSSQYTLTTSSPTGTYHSVVYPSGTTPPSSYNGAYSVSNPLLADDVFVVIAVPPPIVSSPLYAGATAVSGSSTQPAGSVVTVYKNGVAIGTTTVQSDGTWTLSGVAALADGDQISATQVVSGVSSGLSNVVTVSANAGDVTPAPVISSPIAAGATSVPGTCISGATVDVYADGVYLGTTAASGTAWTLSGVPALASGTILTATATLSPTGTSPLSAPVVVGTMIHLLRSDLMAALTDDRSLCFVRDWSPAHPSMDPLGANHVANWGEGALQQGNGTSDDDKAYIHDIKTNDVDPDSTILTDNGRPLVFYQLLDNDAHTLYLKKSSGQIVFTIDAP